MRKSCHPLGGSGDPSEDSLVEGLAKALENLHILRHMWPFIDDDNTALHKAVIQDNEKLALELANEEALIRENILGLNPKDLAKMLGRRSLIDAWGLNPLKKIPSRGPKDTQTLLRSHQEIEALTHSRYYPSLIFKNYSVLRRIIRQTEVARAKAEKEMLWLGALYKEGIEERYCPEIEICWISDEVGFGVYTQEAIEEGTFVGEYTGLVRRRPYFGFKASDYCFRYPSYRWNWILYSIDAEPGGNFTRFINHSEMPNIESLAIVGEKVMHIVFRATRKIEPGEQLHYDYGPEYWTKRCQPKSLPE